MFTSYLRIAWRNLWKQKVFAAVNVAGMSIAICAALLLSLTAYKEWSYDDFQQKRDHIYQLYREDHRTNGTHISKSFSEPMAGVLRKEVPGVKHVTRIGGDNLFVRYKDKSIYLDVQMTDPDYLQMFSFPLQKGNAHTALDRLDQLVLTQGAAASLFSQDDPIGKTVEINIGDQWKPFVVSAVADNIPDNSSISFEALIRFENVEDYAAIRNDWHTSSYPVMLEVAPAVSMATLRKDLVPVAHKYMGDLIKDLTGMGGTPDEDGEFLRIRTIPLKDLHLSPYSVFGTGLNPFYPWMMLMLACLITGIACVNFINLSIARSFTRGSEIGLRKALGAMDRQLMLQFWSEAFLLCFISLLLSLLLATLLLPYYNATFKHDLSFRLFQNGWLILGTAATFFGITLLAGGYPAWKIARVNIIQVLKGKLNLSGSGGVRNGLIVFQFMVAALLISCTVIIWQQLNFIRATPLGYNTTQVISIPVGNAPQQALTAIRNRLASEPSVESITASTLNLGIGKDGSSGNWTLGFDYKGNHVNTQAMVVDYDYAKTLGLTLLAGRDFSRQYGADTTGVVINEQMAKQLGEKDPLNIVYNANGNDYHVIGVVKDYHFESLRKKIEPLMLSISASARKSYLFVKVNTNHPAATMDRISAIWKEIDPLTKSDPSFLDENTDRLYRQEARFSKIFMSGAVLAILISCMGLFAIAVLVMAQRRKEVGIRKVLGASVSSIVMLLSKDFLKLVLIAVLAATPVSWYLMQRWLNGFALHVEIQWWMFAGVCGLAVLIALATTSLQAVKAALANPVESLKVD
ncbi:MacB-like core domain-containing protein [Chitinophaga eiseniae]|uniref:MacB-like core domain-containing protein n=1 Tax=Chitinophaga eiseniae TaxID=634771 RepID=A0A1T4RRJ0_9BACT|nr:ABC transporter permease [Chitinophaga eiseniae]SKA18635.1 MacB-like core domain-containing protein [Chitinophaga eiseniae]